LTKLHEKEQLVLVEEEHLAEWKDITEETSAQILVKFDDNIFYINTFVKIWEELPPPPGRQRTTKKMGKKKREGRTKGE